MKYLLDTNTCIGWLRSSRPNVIARIRQETPANINVSSVVIGELLYGAERVDPQYQVNNQLRVKQLRRKFASLPFDDAAAEHYGKVRAHLARLGTPIGPNDLMIASIALSNRTILVTNNTTEFQRVPGLQVEDWQ